MTRPLSEYMREAIAAQGKVDPDEVFAEADAVDLDDWPSGTPAWDERDLDDDPGRDPDLYELEPQGSLLDAEERGYGYEP